MTPEPTSEERIAALERENEALRSANARLMRERLGSANTAAATRLVPPARQRLVAVELVRAPFAKARLALRRVLLRLLR
jgi:hypothetical protein